MLTKRNWEDGRHGVCWSLIFLFATGLLLSGCTPAGPGALLDGKKLIERGKYSKAVEKLKTATTLLPNNANAWNYLGLAYHYVGQPAEAEKAYQRALFYNHDLTEAHYNLGCLFLEQNKTNAAKLEFVAFTLRKGNSLDGLLKLGTAQLRTRDYAGAEKSFTEALNIEKQNPEALNGLGLAKYHRGHSSDAITCFKHALDARSNYPPAVLNLAIVSQQSTRERAFALKEYRTYAALKPAPQNADAVQNVIRELELELNPPRAVVSAAVTQQAPNPPAVNPATTNAVQIEPGSNFAATNSRKVVVVKTSAVSTSAPNPKPAPAHISSPSPETVKLSPEPVIKSAAETPPLAPKTVLPYDRLLANPPPTPQNPDGSRYTYKSPSQPTPGNHLQAERSFNEGLDAQKAQRWQEALTAYKTAAQDDPAYFEAHYNLGLSAVEAGNLPLALNAFEYALAIRSDSADARYSFALALKQANYLPDAIHELDKVLAAHPSEARAHLALGNLYAQQLHDPAKARPHYLKVLEADPHNSQASAIHFWLTENP